MQKSTNVQFCTIHTLLVHANAITRETKHHTSIRYSRLQHIIVMFLVRWLFLSVYLSVDNITQRVMNGLGWNFMDGFLSSTRKNWLNFGGDLGIVRWVNEQKNTIIVVAYPDRGAGNNPEPLFISFFSGGWVVFHNQGSTFLQWEIWE